MLIHVLSLTWNGALEIKIISLEFSYNDVSLKHLWTNYVNILQMVRYEMKDCSMYTTCPAVMEAKNPLCGWCVYENK